MESFDKKKLYDLVVLHYLNIQEGRLKEFANYFYTGFTILKDWYHAYGANTTLELERFVDIFNYLEVKTMVETKNSQHHK